MKPFTPRATATLAGTTVSSAVAIDPGCEQIEVNNAGDTTLFVRWGTTTPTALITDYPVLPGHCKVITIGTGNAFLAGITATGTATAYVTSGQGN